MIDPLGSIREEVCQSVELYFKADGDQAHC